ncbi:outer membrane beta-barrel protein [Arcticibacter tournemirensis]|uniref:TonB-dependent receptor n=1 Tax=Arcticibacter tournemirensis TaxID=699437 RepID=A0A4Q0M3I5_9SPHI|nr:outer membrane beta-barrel protein [Arcticibacter tournemirensis]RXF67239.1 TonB-dependent receptor [Arcticibacter tournemirensis]
MKPLIKSGLLGVVLFFNVLIVSAQTGPVSYSIKGIIVDSASAKALEYVTVSLKSSDNKPLKSALTDGKGVFNFSKIAAGKYAITVISVGHSSKSIPVNIAVGSDRPETNLGTIVLSAKNNQLKEVSVTAERPIIQQEVDRISYDLQADPESKVNNVLDMMRKVPLLSLDADDNIKLQGNSNYKILINGKPSSMVAKNPKDVLRSMPASSIQKIEVITTPPAKYDSEGIAGIINIITTKKVDNGYNGSLNVGGRFPVGGPRIGGNYTVKQGKFGASGYGGFGTYSQPQTSYFSNRVSTGTNPRSLSQNGLREFDNRFVYVGTEFSFEIDTLNLITAEIGFNNGNYDSKGSQMSQTFSQNSIVEGYTLNNNSENNWKGIDLALNYQLGFKGKKDRMLTFSYRYSNSDDKTFDQLGVSDRINYNTPDYHQHNKSGSGEQTIQADYVHPFKKLTFEAGVKAILRDNNSDFRYDSLNTEGLFATDPRRTNTFDNNQDVIGAYNSYQYNLKNWGFKAGVRIEETLIKANFISTDSDLKKDYFNIIPTISINRKFKDMSSLNFGFTQRIQRPSIWNLNPFVNRSNPNFESTGNPDLRPVLSNDIRLSYSKFKKGSFNIGLNYSFSNNTIQQIAVYDNSRGVTFTSYDNIGKDKSLGSNFNINYPITKKWDFNISGNMNYVWIKGMINGVNVSNDGFRGYFYGGTGYKFEKGWRVNANFSYSSAYITLQGQGNSYYYTSLSVNKELIKNKLTFSASTNNPFAKYREYVNETTGADFTQSSNYRNYFRSYSLSLNYRFGKLEGSIKKNKRGIKNDDVSGGKSSQGE